MSADVSRVVDSVRPKLPRGSTIAIRGQVESMNSSFAGLAFGLVFAVLLVYFLMVVNFQSLARPVHHPHGPARGAGRHPLDAVPDADDDQRAGPDGGDHVHRRGDANSILLVTFANDQRREGHDALDAALAAGATRLRPVLMTALAMIIGMLPMSLGLGEGGEQNAPLGRAVIGGLLVATFSTLLFVPVVYSLLRRKPPAFDAIDDEDAAPVGTA